MVRSRAIRVAETPSQMLQVAAQQKSRARGLSLTTRPAAAARCVLACEAQSNRKDRRVRPPERRSSRIHKERRRPRGRTAIPDVAKKVSRLRSLRGERCRCCAEQPAAAQRPHRYNKRATLTIAGKRAWNQKIIATAKTIPQPSENRPSCCEPIEIKRYTRVSSMT